MIYLDNAAGSHPKPEIVRNTVFRALTELGASPGRGRHSLARHTADTVERVRGQLAELIHAPDPSRIVFTAGATMSLNMAIWGYLSSRGGHVLCSSMEHNAMVRPLLALAEQGKIQLELIPADRWGYLDTGSLLSRIRLDTALLAMSHASNVNGAVQPLEEICRICSSMKIPLLLDASQSLGLLPVDVQQLDIALLAIAGHKALYGPAGVGALYVRPGMELSPLLSGGTGGQSERHSMPEEYPQHLEAGSLNVSGIAGLGAGLDFLGAAGQENIYHYCMEICSSLSEEAAILSGVKIFWGKRDRPRIPVFSMSIYGFSPDEAADALDKLGVCIRAGYHCAPLAHQSLGSLERDGLIRFSPSRFTSREEARLAVLALEKIIREKAEKNS